MKQQLTLEVSAPTIEEAIEKGLDELGLEYEEVEIEIIDEGKRNLFRFTAREAVVKLTVRQSVFNPEIMVSKVEKEENEILYADISDEETDEEGTIDSEINVEDDYSLESMLSSDRSGEQETIQKTVEKLLDFMETRAVVSVEPKISEDENREFYAIEIQGDDLSYLIGRRSETLNAIQYMVSLMSSHQFGRWIPLQVDIQNYRARRQTELRKIAHRMADQVVSTGRRQSLEPMPANERRIIHIELRKREDVYTESVGVDPYRKVQIYPSE